jgi:hypothetical protein
MTTQQQTDLKTWLQNQEQPLPESLKMVFVKDSIDYIRKNFDSFYRIYGELPILENNDTLADCVGEIQWNLDRTILQNYENIEKYDLILFIQTLLSRIDGKAVLEFLDKKIDTENYIFIDFDKALYQEFTEALRVGKNFDEALEIITKIYLKELYV